MHAACDDCGTGNGNSCEHGICFVQFHAMVPAEGASEDHCGIFHSTWSWPHAESLGTLTGAAVIIPAVIIAATGTFWLQHKC